ncbi:MAG: glycosyltransferase family 4 protein [Ignavibacteria bacterium]|nr:glycosyltransferase family 4 protein [Ignavibacteria bacterium]
MNIGMVVDNEFIGDIRIENEVSALEKAGFSVFILCLSYGHEKTEEKFNNSTIVRVKAKKYFIKKFRALTNTILNIYPAWWAKRINEFVKKYKIDVLHIHDLYMFGAGIKVKEKYKLHIPIIGDLHENYVEGLKKYKFSNTFPGKYLISIPKWERTEVEWISKMDFIVTVIEEAVDRYSSLGLDRNKFSVVANYVNIEEYLKMFELHKIQKDNKHFTVTYIGAFDLHRGLESVVKAIPSIVNIIGNLKVVLVGSGKNIESLKKMSRELEISEFIKFEGWQPHGKLPAYINASDICIIPHLKTKHTDNTIPHKLFQYMLFEKPVVATNCNPIKRIVEQEECGSIYKTGDSDDLAEKIIALHRDNLKMQLMGKKGKEAVIAKYNWQNTSKILVNLYKSLIK